MKKLFPSFANPVSWRTVAPDMTSRKKWKQIRMKILERDDYACQYCGFKAEKWQIVHHIDGNPNNNSPNNLMVVCQMCNLIEHAGMGCIIQGIVDLYKKSNYTQNQIIIKTREMRAKNKTDEKIIKELGLKEKTEFRQDWNYLKPLYGFVSSRKAEDEKTSTALEYEYNITRKQINEETKNMKPLTLFEEKEEQNEFQCFGGQNNKMKENEVTQEQLEDLTLLMIFLQSWKEKLFDGTEILRAWKGYDFNVLNKLNDKEFVNDKPGNKSLYLTEKGIKKSKEILSKISFRKE